MKKTILVLTAIALFVVGCKKEEVIKSSNPSITQNITTQNGILVFKDKASLNTTVNKLNQMSKINRQVWENKHDFVSQESIYNQINTAEIKFEETLFAGLDENTSIEELNRLGLTNQHTTLYNNNIQNGLIKEIEEEDGSQYFELNLLNKAMASVVNEKGLVIVENKAYQYTACCTKILNSTNQNEIVSLDETTQTSENNHIIVFDETKNLTERVKSTWSKNSGWIKDGNVRRYSFDIYGVSDISISNLLNSSFYIEAKGQKKVLWRWKYSSNYNPIAEISGNWNYSYETIKIDGFNPIVKSDLPDNDIIGRIHFKSGEPTNHYKAFLSPNGVWSITSPYIFYSPIDVYEYDFLANFYGGPSGFSIHHKKTR